MKHYVLVGATSAIAEHCARLWIADEPAIISLVGRSAPRLERVKNDLLVRSPASRIQTFLCDFLAPDDILRCVGEIGAIAHIDTVLIAHGSLPDQAECERDLHVCQNALLVNGVSPALFAEAFVPKMLEQAGGTLAVIGSVAGDRGRKTNYVYGAAKGLIGRYVQGLQHRLSGTPVRVVMIKPGPTDTPMTAHLKSAGTKLAPPEIVAKCIVGAVAKGESETYAPRIWRWVMLIIQHLPRFVFNRLNI